MSSIGRPTFRIVPISGMNIISMKQVHPGSPLQDNALQIKHLTEKEFTTKLGTMNKALEEYDSIGAKMRKGESTTESEKTLLANESIEKLAEERANFVKENYAVHRLVSATAGSSQLREHLETHFNEVDLGSTVDISRFGGAAALIGFSEWLLGGAYRGEISTGAELILNMRPDGQESLSGHIRFLEAGEKIDGVDVGPTGPGGRVVLRVRFDKPIGNEGIAELPDDTQRIFVDRKSGGRSEQVRVLHGDKPPTNDLYIIGGSYGPTGMYGLYTIFSGRYSPSINDAAYWGGYAYLTGDSSRMWRVTVTGSLVVDRHSALSQMVAEGKVNADSVEARALNFNHLLYPETAPAHKIKDAVWYWTQETAPLLYYEEVVDPTSF